MGAILMTEEIASAIKPGDHGTTFGGGPFVASVALHVFERAFPIEQLRALEQLSDFVALFEPFLGVQSEEEQLVSRVGIEAMLESERNPVLRQRLAEQLNDYRRTVADLARA